MGLKGNWKILENSIEGIPNSGDDISVEPINQIADAVIELEENGVGGGIITETDPTVPEWAKQPNKPRYNVDEITNAVHKDDLGNVKELEIGNDAVDGINMLYQSKADKENVNKAIEELNQKIENIPTGDGEEEIYIGTEQPTDPNIKLWINPNGNPGTTTAEDGNEVEY